MYNEHFGLNRAPFRITPDTRLFYSGGSRGDILEALLYAVTSGEGIVKVVGEVGSGKTMLCRMLEERLPETVEVVYLANPSLSPEDTLHAIALEMNLDVDSGANRLQVMHVLQQHLLEKHAANRQVVVFVEEAQSMPIATLEEIRLLSNLETKRDKLLQIVLFGQPELDENLDQVAIRQLKERITHSFYLQPFTTDQIREYVNFRLRAVGYRGPDMFRAGAYRLMAQASAGLTRRVNILADKALLAAFADDSHEVTARHVATAIKDSQFAERRRGRLPEISVALGVMIIVAAVAWGLVAGDTRWLDRASSLLAPRATSPGAVADADMPSTSAESPGDSTARAGGPAPEREDALPATARGPQAAPSAAVIAKPPATARKAGTDQGRRALRVATADGGGRLLLSDSLSREFSSGAATQAAEKGETEPGVDSAPREPGPAPASVPSASPDERGAARSSAVPPAAAAPAALDQASARESVEALTASDVGPLTRERLVATRQWLRDADGAHFSIQLLLTDHAQRANLERFLRERHLAGEIADYYVYQTRIRRRVWYGVLYREYASFGAAKAALDELPDEFRRHRPFIRNVRDIASAYAPPAAATGSSDPEDGARAATDT